MIGYHLVVLPKHDDQSKAILAACTDKQLIKLAAKEFTHSSDGGKFAMPKILDKAGVYNISLFADCVMI